MYQYAARKLLREARIILFQRLFNVSKLSYGLRTLEYTERRDELSQVILRDDSRRSTVASWFIVPLVSGSCGLGSSPGRAHCCSWARHFHSASLHPRVLTKWVPANLMPGVTLRYGLASHSVRGRNILLVVSCHRNRDKLRPDGSG